MPFTPKDWNDAPPGWKPGYPLPEGATPISAAALEDIEDRVTDYTDAQMATALKLGVENNGGVSIVPPAGQVFRTRSSAAVTQDAGAPPFYIIPPGSPGLTVDEWGNIWGGEAPIGLIPSEVRSGSPDVTLNSTGRLIDFAYFARQRRIYSRHCFLNEINNPANLRLARVNASDDQYPWPTTDGSQYGTPDYTQLRGIDAFQTLGKIVFEGPVPRWPQPGGSAGTIAQFQQESAEIYCYSAEPFTHTADGNHFATGGEMYFMTRPLGDSTGLGNEAKPDRLGINPFGVVAVMGPNIDKAVLRAKTTRGDLLTSGGLKTFGSEGLMIHRQGVEAQYLKVTASGSEVHFMTTDSQAISLKPNNQLALTVDVSGGNPVVGLFGSAGTTKPTVTGSRGANAALASLLTALAGLGALTDSSTA